MEGIGALHVLEVCRQAAEQLRQGRLCCSSVKEQGVHRGQLLPGSQEEISRVPMESFQRGGGSVALQVTKGTLGPRCVSPIHVCCQNIRES